jgi:RimJ/RimL family protein N-acetyltransferase
LRIGAPYRWPSESWGQAQWSDYLADPAREYWIVRHTGEVAGLGEFQLQGGGSLEITTFGLVPEYVGQGIGGNALTLVLQQAWRHNGVAASGCARRVQHPNAPKTTTTAASG